MRNDTTFRDTKLTREEFSRKYWKGGLVPHQYHTADIEDGRDEREQFLINNCRALWELIRSKDAYTRQSMDSLSERIEKLESRISGL